MLKISFSNYLSKNFIIGLCLSLLTAGILLYWDLTIYRIPSSPGIFSTVITLIAFQFGLAAGLIGALIAVIYTAIHFSDTQLLFTYNDADLTRVIMWTIIFPLQGVLIGLLKERLIKKIESENTLQQKLVATSKLVATGEMAAGIAHEINTPLGAIVLNAEMILAEIELASEPNQEIVKRAQAINSIALRISKIIDGLKGISRDGSNDKKQIFSVNDLITSTMDFCNERFKNNGVEILVKENFLNTLIEGQMTQLSQTLLNLLNNSFDAIQNLDQKWIHLDADVKSDFVELNITDSGPGIPEKVIEKMFQPFFTMKEIGKGTGLGLSISQRIVRDHKGTLSYAHGFPNTRFIIRLPILKNEKSLA